MLSCFLSDSDGQWRAVEALKQSIFKLKKYYFSGQIITPGKAGCERIGSGGGDNAYKMGRKKAKSIHFKVVLAALFALF